jgi:hypothetical protein
MRTWHMTLLKLTAWTQIDDFNCFVRLDLRFKFKRVDCSHNVPSGLEYTEACASALISPWLLLGISCLNARRKPPDSFHILPEMPFRPPNAVSVLKSAGIRC